MVRFVDIRVSTRLALAAAVFTVSKENMFRFLACYVISTWSVDHTFLKKKIMSGVVYGC